MKYVLRILTWQSTLLLSVVILCVLDVLNFYGLYTNKFYFSKFDNYIFPVLSIVHFVYLYALWFKIRKKEFPDVPMRNLEYALYIISFVYVFKFFDTLLILLSYNEFDSYVIPHTFIPIGVTTLFLYLLLLLVTWVSFVYRKKMVGGYGFEDIHDQHL